MSNTDGYYPPIIEKVRRSRASSPWRCRGLFPRGHRYHDFSRSRSPARTSRASRRAPTRDAGVSSRRSGISLVEGRLPTWSDRSHQPHGSSSSAKSLARALDGNVVERRVKISTLRDSQDSPIIGVVVNATHGDPKRQRRPRASIGRCRRSPVSSRAPNVIVRTTGPEAAAMAAIRRIVRRGRQGVRPGDHHARRLVRPGRRQPSA